MTTKDERATKIAALNDALRNTLQDGPPTFICSAICSSCDHSSFDRCSASSYPGLPSSLISSTTAKYHSG